VLLDLHRNHRKADPFAPLHAAPPMLLRQLRPHRLLAALALAILACVPSAARADAPAFAPGQVVVRLKGEDRARAYPLPGGIGVRRAARALDANPAVAYAVPDVIAEASSWVPDDPGRAGTARGWKKMQWNFLAADPGCGQPNPPDGIVCGIDALTAWRNLRNVGRGGASGIRIAVVDTGVAYRRKRPLFLRSPDFLWRQFTRARYDFVGDDRVPLDKNGHGTHVAGTIGEQVNNDRALTGLAYHAKIMPVRALNADGKGDASDIAAAIRFAADHHADIVNMSFEFPDGTSSSTIPEILEATRYAHRKGAVLIAAAGNKSDRTQVAYPARAGHVIAVGATTVRGCLSSFSDSGAGLDLVAPGGGADDPTAIGSCVPLRGSRPIFQLTFTQPNNFHRFGYPADYEGTSMACAHVAGVAALVLAAGTAGTDPTPDDVETRLESTARDLGTPGSDNSYGAGLLDAAAATATP
jgi:serine protease